MEALGGPRVLPRYGDRVAIPTPPHLRPYQHPVNWNVPARERQPSCALAAFIHLFYGPNNGCVRLRLSVVESDTRTTTRHPVCSYVGSVSVHAAGKQWPQLIQYSTQDVIHALAGGSTITAMLAGRPPRWLVMPASFYSAVVGYLCVLQHVTAFARLLGHECHHLRVYGIRRSGSYALWPPRGSRFGRLLRA